MPADGEVRPVLPALHGRHPGTRADPLAESTTSPTVMARSEIGGCFGGTGRLAAYIPISPRERPLPHVPAHSCGKAFVSAPFPCSVFVTTSAWER